MRFLEDWNFLFFFAFASTAWSQLQFTDEKYLVDSKNIIRYNYKFVYEPKQKKINRTIRATNESPKKDKTQTRLYPNSYGFVGQKVADNVLNIQNEKGKQKVRLLRFQRQNPPDFYAAIGAVSAHLASQLPRTTRIGPRRPQRQEYIPYPPNGNPFNHPSYNGVSQGETGPSSLPLAPYDFFSHGNTYQFQPSTNVNPYNRDSGFNDPSFTFPSGFGGSPAFNPNYLLHGFVPIAKSDDDREPIEEDGRLSEVRRQNIPKPIK